MEAAPCFATPLPHWTTCRQRAPSFGNNYRLVPILPWNTGTHPPQETEPVVRRVEQNYAWHTECLRQCNGRHLQLCADVVEGLIDERLRLDFFERWRQPGEIEGNAANEGGPVGGRLGLDDGSGFDVTEQGTEKRLALWVVRDVADA